MAILITSAAVVIYPHVPMSQLWHPVTLVGQFKAPIVVAISMFTVVVATRSEEHTSELQSRVDLVCRLLLEKKKTDMSATTAAHTSPSPCSKRRQPVRRSWTHSGCSAITSSRACAVSARTITLWQPSPAQRV